MPMSRVNGRATQLSADSPSRKNTKRIGVSLSAHPELYCDYLLLLLAPALFDNAPNCCFGVIKVDTVFPTLFAFHNAPVKEFVVLDLILAEHLVLSGLERVGEHHGGIEIRYRYQFHQCWITLQPTNFVCLANLSHSPVFVFVCQCDSHYYPYPQLLSKQLLLILRTLLRY